MKNADSARQSPPGYILLNVFFLQQQLTATDNNLTADFNFSSYSY